MLNQIIALHQENNIKAILNDFKSLILTNNMTKSCFFLLTVL